MLWRANSHSEFQQGPQAGFSLMELMVSVAIIVLLMSAVFPFLFQSQKKYQENQVVSEANQSARAASIFGAELVAAKAC